MICLSYFNYNNYLKEAKNNNYLKKKKVEYKELVYNVDLYKKYIDYYSIVFDEEKSLEEKLNEITKDINTKRERVDYYKNSISKMNKVVR